MSIQRISVNPMGAMLSTLHRSHEKGLVSAMTGTRDESDTQRSILYQKYKDHKDLLTRSQKYAEVI